MTDMRAISFATHFTPGLNASLCGWSWRPGSAILLPASWQVWLWAGRWRKPFNAAPASGFGVRSFEPSRFGTLPGAAIRFLTCSAYRNYETKDNSRNNIIVALITNGEGWHNNHHAEPGSASNQHHW